MTGGTAAAEREGREAAADATAAPPGTAPEDAYAAFLDEMDALGLVRDLEDELPPEFSAVFEIGRLLATPGSQLGRALGAALELRQTGAALAAQQAAPDVVSPEGRVEVPAAEEYEAEFVRSWSDVQYVYSWQWLLPDEEFLRRLAQRTLWFPMAKAPRIRAIESGEDDFEPTPSKQKVHVLFDTSASMALHHRFALAKAAVLRFLRVNRREMGEVLFRTFDADVGPLESAADAAAYDDLIRKVARRRTLGNGTCLERAILQACKDVRDRRGIAGAEILVVTDGAAHLDEFAVRQALGDDVELHCVKIGRVEVTATDQWVADQLDFSRNDRTRREQRILRLRERRDRLEMSLKVATDEPTRLAVKRGLRECEQEREEISSELRTGYGHEIERLSHVFVQVPDLDSAALRLDPERLASLERLVRDMLARLAEAPAPPHLLKQAALLLSHVAMLHSEQRDPVVREILDRLRTDLERELGSAVEYHEARVLDAGLLSPADQRDLRVLLRRGVARHSSLWLALLRYFYGFVARFTSRR